MAERFTIVSNWTWSYAVRGTKTRDVAIAEARDSALVEVQRLNQFMALRDDPLTVRVVEGLYREKLVREL